MRKAWALFLFIAVMLVLTACGSSEETRTFEMNEGGIDSTLVYTYSGDEVISQDAENIVNYEELDYDEAQNVTGIELEGNPEEGVSMERSAEMLESQGYTEVGGDTEE